VRYMHSDIDTLERIEIIRDLRLGAFDALVGINLLREGLDIPECALVAILDADKEGFLRSAWSLIQMSGRAARNIGGEVIMYADRITESMRVAMDETDRRRAVQEAYNLARGIEPTTIVKGIRDINERLRAVAESTVVYASERTGEFSEADRAKVGALVARMEAEMKSAAKQLEFERAAALRDEIQQIRLRVLQEDASITVGRAAERAAGTSGGRGLTGAADRARGRRGAAAAVASGPAMEVTSVTVLPADEEPSDNLDGVPGEPGIDEGTVADWLPGIRDEHEDEAGWQARWLDRPTWDRTVTPNIRKRTGQRPGRRR
jgi:superfamily II DNA/RNA helicase